MKHFLVTSLLLITSLFSASTLVSAQSNTLEPVDCFADGLYKFQSVQVSVGPEETSYTAGDTINFSGQVINENKYPVVDGNVFVRISKVNPNSDVDTVWHNVVDEFIAISDLSINGQSSTSVAFSWKAPVLLGQGDYRADYFFSVGKRFNLGGLPFTNEIIIGTANFNIKNSTDTIFTLDRNQTKVNGEIYSHVGNWPNFASSTEVKFTQPLKNLSDKPIEVVVEYDLYYWDSLREEDKIDTKTEQVKVPAKGSVDLSYIIKKINEPVYYLRIKTTHGGVSSIVNLRITSDIIKQRINYPAINQFPLLEGKEATIFSCFHMTSNTIDKSKLILSLIDKKGKIISSGEYIGDIGAKMSAAMFNFVPSSDYSFLTLKAELFNSQGSLVDKYETQYDCNEIGGEGCVKFIKPLNDNQNLIFIVLFSLIIILILVRFLFRKNKNSKFNKALTILLFIMISLLAIFVIKDILFYHYKLATAESISVNGISKTETRSGIYEIRGFDGSRFITSGYLNITHTVSLNSSNLTRLFDGSWSVPSGSSFSFTQNSSCSFSASSGAWDTPTCGSALTFSNGYDENGAVDFPAYNEPSKSITSSDPSVISCTGLNCVAIKNGCSDLSVTVSSFSNSPRACATWDNSSGSGVACTASGITVGPYTWDNHSQTIYLTASGASIGSYTTSPWRVCVAEDRPTTCFRPEDKFKLTDLANNFYTLDLLCKLYGSNWEFADISAADENIILNNGNPLFPNTTFAIKNTASNVEPFKGSYNDVCKIETTWPETSKMVLFQLGTDDLPDRPLCYSDVSKVTMSYKGLCRNTSYNSLPVCPTLTAICSVSPNPAEANQVVSWLAHPSGGSGTYTYSWSGEGLTGKTTQTATTSYLTTGLKYATSTISDGISTTTVPCFGIIRTDCIGCSPSSGSTHPGVLIDTAKCGTAVNTCDPGILLDTDDTSSDSNWKCLGFNDSIITDDKTCSLPISAVPDNSIYNCESLTTSSAYPILVNTNTTWTALPNIGSFTWVISDSAGDITSTETSNIMNKIFTTVGEKIITVTIASSSNPSLRGTSCSTTTRVTQQDGSIGEI